MRLALRTWIASELYFLWSVRLWSNDIKQLGQSGTAVAVVGALSRRIVQVGSDYEGRDEGILAKAVTCEAFGMDLTQVSMRSLLTDYICEKCRTF